MEKEAYTLWSPYSSLASAPSRTGPPLVSDMPLGPPDAAQIPPCTVGAPESLQLTPSLFVVLTLVLVLVCVLFRELRAVFYPKSAVWAPRPVPGRGESLGRQIK